MPGFQIIKCIICYREEGAKGWLKQSQNFRQSFGKQDSGSSLKTTYDHTKNVSLYISGIPVGLSEVTYFCPIVHLLYSCCVGGVE